MGKHLLDEDIVAEEGDSLRENVIIVVEGRGDYPFIEDGVGEDIDEENFPLSDGEAEEMVGDSIGVGV